ncbi:thioredoxin-like domain-containing protein [uncultured Lacinutrix sp.]|uniref:thioredoxin-like domain-containing protein n=1 Tax=uncultured Lacinutrix sp. TaxID=574032 RepID=UPI00262CA7F3|nr:thioredoxin-like domain-containing protein [uncultured Lacinutrix sp.]
MKKYVLLLVFMLSLTNCKAQVEAEKFSKEALADVFIDQEGSNVMFSDILKKYEGKQIFIDIWASWCKDCIKGMPKVKQLQNNNPDTVFLYLSLDKSLQSWKRGIEKHQVEGEHYYMKSGWKGEFATFLDLDWIPRYLIINKSGDITLFRAIKADDKNIKAILK